MDDYVIMPQADYQDACDATREKTGGTELLKSGELGAAIRGIQTGDSDGCGAPLTDYYGIVAPTKAQLEALGYTVDEFTLVSTPTTKWQIPNPKGEPLTEIVMLIAKTPVLGYPCFAANNEFPNGTYINQNTYSFGAVNTNGVGEVVLFNLNYGQFRWLEGIPDADYIYLRSPAANVTVCWQPGDYLIAVK